MSSQLVMLQQQSGLMSSLAGLPRLVQSQLLLACCGGVQPLHRSCCCGCGAAPRQVHTSTAAAAAAAAGEAPGNSSSSSGSGSSKGRAARRREAQYQKRLNAYKARLPKAQKYGTRLLEQDPAAFEQMRLVVGYYDLPQNTGRRRPDPPSHVTINNMQTLLHTQDVDPYYKLALLSYRSKLENMEVNKGLSKARAFLGQFTALPDFLPAHLEELTTAALKQQQHQQQQQQQQQSQQAEESSSSSGGGGGGSSTADSGSSESSSST